MPPEPRDQPIAVVEPPEHAGSRAMLLRELRRPAAPFRWGWMENALWPAAAVFGVLGYRVSTAHGWNFASAGCTLLSFNFAVSAIASQVTAPYRRKVELLAELAEHLSPEDRE